MELKVKIDLQDEILAEVVDDILDVYIDEALTLAIDLASLGPVKEGSADEDVYWISDFISTTCGEMRKVFKHIGG